jgi:hypothetical protein
VSLLMIIAAVVVLLVVRWFGSGASFHQGQAP